MSRRVDHASHNEKVSNYLAKRPTYADWVVTTAFYSAYHYVLHRLFPMELAANGDTTKANSLSEYRTAMRQLTGQTDPNLHRVVTRLVDERFVEVSADYRWLRDRCHTARYVDYKMARETSSEAKRRLQRIKKYCTA